MALSVPSRLRDVSDLNDQPIAKRHRSKGKCRDAAAQNAQEEQMHHYYAACEKDIFQSQEIQSRFTCTRARLEY
jgi:hypothetical protein